MSGHAIEKYGLASETFTLVLDKQVQPGPVTTLSCKFSYIWDFPRAMGHATLVSVDGIECNINMFPMGLQGRLDFMGDHKQTVYIPGGSFFLYRVVLQMIGAEKSAMMMIGEDGDEILATQNYNDDNEAAKAFTRRGD